MPEKRLKTIQCSVRIYFLPDCFLEEVLLDYDIGRVGKLQKQGVGAIHVQGRCDSGVG